MTLPSKLVSYVHTVQLKLKIEEATLPLNDEPTPPWVLDEVTNAIGSNRKNVDDAVDCLEQRLQFRSTLTKQKALKLIKHMSLKGSAELQRALVRLSGQIKELQTYRCAPDAFKGDVPWKRVQEYAKEALEAIHGVKEGGVQGSGDWSSRGNLSMSSLGGKPMEGFGSDGAGSGWTTGGSATSTSRRYEGFGSKSARGPSNALEHDPGDVQNMPFGAKLAMGLSELKSAALAGAAGLGEYAGAYTGKGATGSPEASGYRSTYSPPARPQIDVDAFEEHGYTSHSTRNAMTPMSSASNASNAASGGSARKASALQGPEERLVQQFVAKSQGVRVAPTVDECTKFLTSCVGHGSLPLAKAFERTVAHGTWKEVLRALCVLDVAATGGGISGTPAVSCIVTYFKEHPVSLQRASDSAQERVKSKAVSVLGRMGVPCRPAVGTSSVAGDARAGQSGDERVPGDASGATIDLLCMDGLEDLAGIDGSGVSPTHGITNGASTTGESHLSSLLDALDVSDAGLGSTVAGEIERTTPSEPNSPVAGLISAGPGVQSKPSDPFGDWLGVEKASPVPTSPAAVPNSGTSPAPLDPFAAVDLGLPHPAKQSPPNNGPMSSQMSTPMSMSMSKAAKPPVLDDFFKSTPITSSPTTTTTTTTTATANTTSSLAPSDVQGAWHATTSGFTSSQREEAAFDFGELSQL
jgi:hypothetical protein